MIEERQGVGPGARERQDLLSHLLHAHDEEGGERMSDRQLRDEILTLFVAGHETTATALAWALYLLARHPDVEAALRAEIGRLGDRAPTTADLPRLALATRVFKESLRMYPPVPILERQASGPVEARRDPARPERLCRRLPVGDPSPARALARSRPVRSGSLPTGA